VMTKQLERHYSDLFQKYGDSVQACQFGSEESQLFRFKQLIQIADLEKATILDLGCGRGDLYDYLCKLNIEVSYTGIDLVGGTVNLAREKYPAARFLKRDLLSQTLEEKFDYVFLNGVFNNNFGSSPEKNDDYMQALLKTAFQYCERGMAFNFISRYVNFEDEEMAYHDPSRVLRFCIEELSTRVNLMHHYGRCDVAVYVYR
jgi:SAM-dependent methyltransferase